MVVSVEYGNLLQADAYGRLATQMTALAQYAEATKPGEAHEVNVTPAAAWGADAKALIAKARGLFYQAVETIRQG